MILVFTFILVTKITVSDSVSSFKKIPEVEVNDVYTSNDMVMMTNVSMAEECALMCESLGKSRCQSFNVRPQETGLQCEMFDHIPTNGTMMGEDQNAKLYELCEPLYVVASMKERLKDNQTLVTLVDDKGAVYQAKSSDPTLRVIGNYRTVFEGFEGRLDDAMRATLPPFGDVHFIRDGEWLYCFRAIDETRQRFLPCEPKDAFPLHYTQMSKDPEYEPPIWVTNDGINIVFSVYQSTVQFLEIEIPKGFHTDILKPGSWLAEYTCHSPFCSFLPLFRGSSSGLFISISEIGLFYGEKYYVYDFRAHKIALRHSVCRGEDVSYIWRHY